ncbi:Imm50 family immunity protein [Streptomyces sp. NPDC051921]|uniref:Imm50 family immunity protein n=1 Tax=Streptomyces sp. NPDC051921 TaxID=3155806 RepID=UPI003415C7CC
MTWVSLLADSGGLDRIYGGRPPALTSVRLHAVEVGREGPSLNLRFDLDVYPEQPPAKWAAQGYNTVQVTLSLGGLRDVTMNGFGTDPVVDISVEGTDGVTLDIHSDEVQLHAVADAAYVSRISAYASAG